MEEHSIKVKPIAAPVWLGLEIAQIPLFIITPKCRKKTNHYQHLIHKMKAENKREYV